MIIVRLVCVHRHRHHAGNFERFRLRRVFFCCSLFRISLPMEITSSCVYNNVVAVCGRTTTARADPSSSLTPCCNKCVSFFFAGHARYTRSHTGDYWWVIAGYRASAAADGRKRYVGLAYVCVVWYMVEIAFKCIPNHIDHIAYYTSYSCARLFI